MTFTTTANECSLPLNNAVKSFKKRALLIHWY